MTRARSSGPCVGPERPTGAAAQPPSDGNGRKSFSPIPFAAFAVLAPVLLFCLAPAPCLAQTPGPATAFLQQLGFNPPLGEAVPLDLAFRDHTGRRVRLRDYFGDKPVVLTLVYFECPMLCNMTRDGLVRSLRTLSLSAGEDFTLLTVSFDPREGPDEAARARQSSLRRYAREGAERGWHFLTGDAEAIAELARGVGFQYAWDEKAGRYAHAAGLLVLTPDGRIARFFGGVEYSGRDLRLGLVESSAGRIGTAVDQVLLLCYQYDPSVGKYGLAILNTIRVAGTVTVLALATMIAVFLRRERRQRAFVTRGPPSTEGSG